MTRETTSFVYVAYIRATPEQVFEAITVPEIASRHWGHANVSDWKPGSRWEHVRNETGAVGIVGEVMANTPARQLVMSWASADEADDASKHSRVTFDLAPYDGMVRLTMTHDRLEPGSGMAAGVAEGWPIVLSSLKSFLETGEGLDVFAKPHESALAA